MSQVFHIFKKDVRHLWPRIVIVLLLMAAHAYYDIRSVPYEIPETRTINTLAMLLSMVLPLAMWFLIASAIIEEALPGDRQFWLTRPYRRTSLFAAKVLFILVFISVPLFLSDCYILATQGFMVAGVLAKLLLRQLLLAALFILPSFTLATVATGIVQFVLAWFILLLALILETIIGSALFSPHDLGVVIGLGGPRGAWILIAVACAAVIWQYTCRQTAIARSTLLLLVCGFLPANEAIDRLCLRNATPVYRVQPDSGRPDIQLTYDLMPSGGRQSTASSITAYVPVSIAGLPANTLLQGVGQVTMRLDGKPWPAFREHPAASIERFPYGGYFEGITFDRSALAQLQAHRSDLQSSLDLQLITDQVTYTMPTSAHSARVPGIGLCRIAQVPTQTAFFCRAGLEDLTETTIRFDTDQGRSETPVAQRSSLPAGLGPTTEVVSQPNLTGSGIQFIPRHVIAKLHRNLNVTGLDLSRYIMLPSPSEFSQQLPVNSPANSHN